MIPDDGPLGLPHAALRAWAVVVLSVWAAATLVIAFRGSGARLPRRRPPAWLTVAATALAVRIALSLVVDGHMYDVLVSYRTIGDRLFSGGEIWTGTTESLATYPPTSYVWWAVAALVPAQHPHVFAALVRAPFWLADTAIAVALLRVIPGENGMRAAWIYALCPVVIAVPTLHGQADPVVDLLLLIGVVWVGRGRPLAGGSAIGFAIAIKQWPVFVLLPILVRVPRRLVLQFLLVVAAPLLVAFGAYGVVHPQDAVRGFVDIATYRPHREGLGTSLLLPVPAGPIIAANIAVTLGAALAGAALVRSGRSLAEGVALNLLLIVGLSPTVSDQYLMWAFPFLLLAGHARTAALLGVGLLPAVVSLDLWSAQNDGATSNVLLVLATVSVLAAAASLLPRPRRRPTPSVAAVTPVAAAAG